MVDESVGQTLRSMANGFCFRVVALCAVITHRLRTGLVEPTSPDADTSEADALLPDDTSGERRGDV